MDMTTISTNVPTYLLKHQSQAAACTGKCVRWTRNQLARLYNIILRSSRDDQCPWWGRAHKQQLSGTLH